MLNVTLYNFLEKKMFLISWKKNTKIFEADVLTLAVGMAPKIRNFSRALREKILTLHYWGLSCREIGNNLNLNISVVCYLIKENKRYWFNP